MPARLITPPATEPVTLLEVKTHLRVEDDYTDEDALILAQIRAARSYVEEATGRALIAQTWQLWLDCWPADGVIRLPRPRLQKVEYVKYFDRNGNERTLDPETYVVDTISEPGRMVLAAGASWPLEYLRPVNGIVVEYVAGYGDKADDVPADLVAFIKLLVGAMYENREKEVTGTVAARLEFADALLAPHRVLF